MNKITSDTIFPRSITIKDKEGNEVFGWTMQPYITGMYIAYRPSGQGSIAHSKVSEYLKGIQKTAKKNRHTVEIYESSYGA